MRICKKCGATTESTFCESCGTLTSPRIERRTQSKRGDTFEATVWPGPSNTRGIRIGIRNRELYLSPLQGTIVLHIDGVRCVARLSDSFWNQCPEIRVATDDSGRNFLAVWIQKHGLQPPQIARRLRGKPDLVVFRVIEPENEFAVSVKGS